MNKTIISFHQLYQQYEKDVYRFAYWLCGSQAEAKDISAETFIRVWTVKSELRAETIKGYLLTIARNVYLQNRNNDKPQVELDQLLPDTGPNTDEQALSQIELKRLVYDLQKLPELDRTVLIMKSYEGLSYQEMSELLGLSITSLKVKIHRARKKLISSYHRGED